MENDDINSDAPLSWEDDSDATKLLLEQKIKQAELKQLQKEEIELQKK